MDKVAWLYAFLALYGAYGIFRGIGDGRSAKTAPDHFIAGRGVSLWMFVLAATLVSFSGWTFMGHPDLIHRDGFQYAYASFFAITIPFTGVLFLKRQWMLGKRFGYVTPGEMLADYFQGDAIRILTVCVALLFSVPFIAVQLGASGFLFNILTDGTIDKNTGMGIVATFMLVYVVVGGLRTAMRMDAVVCVLTALAIVIIGFIALDAVGGWDTLQQGLAQLGKTKTGTWGSTQGYGGGDYNAYFAMPGVIQWTAGLGKEAPVGGLWTGVMCLTYMLALMGIQSSPTFSMWAFSSSSPKPFAPQQVWASAFAVGFILFFFMVFQGMGAHLLGANGSVSTAGLALNNVLPDLTLPAFKTQGGLVAYYLNGIGETAPWLVGLLAAAALAAMQATGSTYMSTTGSMLSRDLYRHYLRPRASDVAQKLFARISVLFVVIAALWVATFSTDALVLLGGLAVAFGFQMWPSLASVTWFPWLTRQGVTLGLFFGLLAVVFTESLGLSVAEFFAVDLPWGRWPLTMHSAFWGMLVNLVFCLPISALTQNRKAHAHRMKYHTFLRQHAGLSTGKRDLKPIAWMMTLAWMFFGIGPGAVLGNDIFGAPDAGVDGWTFGMPSIWAWQILFWVLGVGMMWFLAYKMEMSTMPNATVRAIIEDIPPEQGR